MNIYKKEYFSNEVKEIIESSKKEFKTRYDSKVRLRLEDNKLIIRNLKNPDFLQVHLQILLHCLILIYLVRRYILFVFLLFGHGIALHILLLHNFR